GAIRAVASIGQDAVHTPALLRREVQRIQQKIARNAEQGHLLHARRARSAAHPVPPRKAREDCGRQGPRRPGPSPIHRAPAASATTSATSGGRPDATHAAGLGEMTNAANASLPDGFWCRNTIATLAAAPSRTGPAHRAKVLCTLSNSTRRSSVFAM